MPSLAGPRAKVEWARSHLDAFDKASRVFLERYSDCIISEVNHKTGEKVWIFHGTVEALPTEFSLRIGDVLYNLRSALDHLVWQLVLANRCTPTTQNAFPIYGPPKRFGREGRRKLSGVGPEAETLIEGLQPCKGGNFALMDLDTLSNMDKHRHLALIMIMTTEGIFGGNNVSLARVLELPSPAYLGPVEDNTILLKVPREYVDMNFNPTIEIGFSCRGHWVSVSKTLRLMLQAVEQTINKFHSFF